jgi:hypothetical protein
MIKVGIKVGLLTVVSFYGYDKRFKTPKKKWNCQCSCKNEIVVLEDDLRSQKKKHCGKCKPIRKFKRYRRFVNKNPRDSPKYRKWCKSVFKRDKYRCVCCGKRGWLNAHHLNGWNWAVAERYLVSNGVTLCAGEGNCHNTFHDRYGRGNNTKQQFLDFMRGRKNG